MTEIQIILLFIPQAKIEEEKRLRMVQIVREEYARVFSCPGNAVNVTLHDGEVKQPDGPDVVLAIRSDKKKLNEGMLRGVFKQAVASRFSLLFPSSLKFSGNVTTRDGLIDMPKGEAQADKAERSDTDADEQDYTKRARNYQATQPVWTFDKVRLPKETREQIDQAIKRIKLEKEVFEEWGLYAIMPNPTAAMSFFGPPGTGKTMAADAIASEMKKPILRASYADIESKYHGEGPKNVGALFLAAEQQDAVLFIDEADSLLSKRLTSVNQGSEQAINSMRSQLLICLEKYHGIVIFATNLVVNYDRAFLSRLINIEFKLPDVELREEIWRAHLYSSDTEKYKLNIPLAEDVNLRELAEKYVVCGRDIRNAVINACVEARSKNQPYVDQAGLERAIQMEVQRYKAVNSAEDHTDAKLSKQSTAAGQPSPLKDVLQGMADEAAKRGAVSSEELS